jgi:hypothetical protein
VIFYFTFARHGPDRQHYVRVVADNVWRACGAALDAIGTLWTDVWDEPEFEVQRILHALTEIEFADVMRWVDRGPHRANYCEMRASDRVWIIDLPGALAVKQDAERVVAELAPRYGDLPFFCYDASGRWCELQRRGQRFIGYAPAAEMTL